MLIMGEHLPVTVGIPAYNNSAHIAEAIKGCLAQTYPALKVIVADDRSADTTAAIVQSFAGSEKVQYIQNEKNLGRVANYRHLLYDLAASGWYINLDGDDYFTDPSFIEQAMALISKTGPDEIVFYQGNHNMEKLKKALPRFTQLNAEDILVEGKEYFINFPRIKKNTHCATLYNRTKAVLLNFYSFDCLFADFHSLSRLALTGKVILSSRQVALWRQHEGNESKSLNEEKLNNELASLKDAALFAEQYLSPAETKNWLKQMTAYYRMVFIYHNSTYHPGWKTIGFILRHWRFNGLYLRYVVKNLWLMIHKNKKPGTVSV